MKILDIINSAHPFIAFDEYDSNMTTKQIIQKTCEKYKIKGNNIKLFADFNELLPNDVPSLYKHKYDFLVLNDVPKKNNFLVTNGSPLTFNLSLSEDNYNEFKSKICSMFLAGNSYLFELITTQNLISFSFIDLTLDYFQKM